MFYIFGYTMKSKCIWISLVMLTSFFFGFTFWPMENPKNHFILEFFKFSNYSCFLKINKLKDAKPWSLQKKMQFLRHFQSVTNWCFCTLVFFYMQKPQRDFHRMPHFEDWVLDGFWPLGNNRSIFILGFCWNLRLVIELWCLEGFWFLLEDFFFAWWNIWISINPFVT